jgi:CHAT domain-containing protein
MVFGGLKYNTPLSHEELWTYLDGTRLEAMQIEKLLRKKISRVYLLTDTSGTEAQFKKKAEESNWLHISTHGFFFPDPQLTPGYEEIQPEEGNVTFRGVRGYGLWQFVNNRNPLMRSGLVFSGANEVWNDEAIVGREDGMLTADEVAVMNLKKCDLVVLSACETGLGEIRGSEGVYGLQRSFKMAGVKFIIMSLWQVPDKETVEFMNVFYKKLLKTSDIRGSFNETQKEMRKKYDPFYWGAFVLVE